MSTEEIPLTSAGAAKLRDELNQLQQVRRPEVAAELHQIQGNEPQAEVNEAAEVETAHAELDALEHRIAELEEILAHAKIIDEVAAGLSPVARLGSVVAVDHDGRRAVYELVGTVEADPTAGKLSIASPAGAALLGKRVGDVVTVEAPAGLRHLRIVELR